MKAGLHIFDFALWDQAITHQPLGVEGEGGFLRFDLFVHQRIGKHRLIAFVMTKAAIANNIDNHVFFEFLTKFRGDAGGMDHGLWIIAIDVENRCFDHQSNVSGIGRGAAEMRRGGEPDLVVHHDVHGAAGFMPFQARQSKPFGHNTLTGKGGIPMQQDRQNAGTLCVVILILFCTRFAQDHRIDGLKVAGVGGERQMHGVAIKFTIRGGAEVVFHIARSIHILRLERAALEFVKDRPVGFGHYIGQHRQAAPVGHANDDVSHAKGAATFDDLLHRWNEAFAAIKPKAFGAHVFDMEEFFEAFRLHQFVENRLATLAGEADFFAVTFNALFEPGGFFGVRNMHILQGESATIGAANNFQNLAHGGELQPQNIIEKDRPVHIGLGETIAGWIQFGAGVIFAHAQRIQIRRQMAANTVGTDQHQGAQTVEHCAFELLLI